MKSTSYGAAFLLTVLLVPVGSEAHHSFIHEYDPEDVIEIRGTVTEVWYQNPHSRVYVEAADSVLWETETYPRNILDRRGWKYDDLKVGDEVVVTGRRARNGSPRLQILTIVRPSDGWEGVGFEPDSID